MLEKHAARNKTFPSRQRELLEHVDLLRLDLYKGQRKERQSALGQFFTPAPLARFMASMLNAQSSSLRILDAGAGVGSLFAACVATICERESHPEHISITAYEIDESLTGHLDETLDLCRLVCERVGISFFGEVIQHNFIVDGVDMLQETLFSQTPIRPQWNCAILNPPYKKIHTQSIERKLLQKVGIESSNLYAGFLALASKLLDPSGELIAITPRSFCNGPYFKSFREDFLQSMSLRRLHVFDSRKQAFSDQDVLQENMIFHAIKDRKKPEKVVISSSAGPNDEFILLYEVKYDQVVHPQDSQSFIHIVPDQLNEQAVFWMENFQTTLAALDVTVSTGRVVDFRALDFLRPEMETGTIPLLFPTHIDYGTITWPKLAGKKPNALLDTEKTKALQVPNEWYVLVKRFTAKEERKRLVAAVYDPTKIPEVYVGFENHLNYFHQHGRGLQPALAKGLAAYLNSTIVDTYFRQFNGHTQVNATDLRNMSYPTLLQLETLGNKIATPFPEQSVLDELIKRVAPWIIPENIS